MHSIAAPSSRFLPSYSRETSGAEAFGSSAGGDVPHHSVLCADARAWDRVPPHPPGAPATGGTSRARRPPAPAGRTAAAAAENP